MPADAVTLANLRAAGPPRWIDALCIAFVIFVAVGVGWMLTGIGGERVRHYVGLLADTPACFCALIVAVEATRRLKSGVTKSAWSFLSTAIALYTAGTMIGVSSWLHGRDPFPGPADLFYLAFYPTLLIAIGLMIRAAAARIRWTQFLLDATILVTGFGAFFWYLTISRAPKHGEVDVFKNAISQLYMGGNCIIVLTFGVLLLAGNATRRGQRISLLLALGFSTMLIADIAWSVAKITGRYIPGELPDVLYLVSYVPMALAGRERMKEATDDATRAVSGLIAQSLPYAAMISAFFVLLALTQGMSSGPATAMTGVTFVLGLFIMLRQGLSLRDDAANRERRAARLVEDHYESLIANASDVIMVVAIDGAIRFASPASERTLGLRPDRAAHGNLFELWRSADADRLRAFLEEVAASTGRPIGPVEMSIDRGSTHFVLEVVGNNLIEDAAVKGLALNFRDITERKILEEQLRKMAFYDPLTLLANRSLFRDRVQHAIALAERGHHQAAVLFLDLDNFKNVNDTLGHEAGDRLLQAVSQRLIESTRASDTVARLGGDEFAILLEGFSDSGEVEHLAAALLGKLDQSFLIGNAQLNVSASIGVALSADDTDTDALLGQADIAMYHAKAAGKSRFVVFHPKMQELLQERLRLQADLQTAIDDGQFVVEYQPVVDLETRALVGLEALVRWRPPALGLLMPARFIQIAEDTGHIVDLGRWVLNRACQDLRAWRETVAGGDALRLAVNISARHLQHGDLVRDVAAALSVSGLEAHNLVLEMTESTIMHHTEANLERLLQLKALGVRLAIDDFGTGYSSLSYLHRFPIDVLKIDRSFVSRLTTSSSGADLARAVITFSQTLGLATVAEGIEIQGELDALIGLGCVAGQGFLFAASGSLEELAQSSFVETRNDLWQPEGAGLEADLIAPENVFHESISAA